jgi:O-antigen/teichoic acid export membrane protein
MTAGPRSPRTDAEAGLLTGRTRRKTAVLLVTHGVNALLQAGFLFLLVRVLGATGFGAWVAAYALVMVLAPFAGWGSPNILIKYVAQDAGQVRIQWGNNLLALGLTALPLLATAVLAGYIVFPDGGILGIVLALALTEFLLSQVVGTAGLLFLTLERPAASSALMGLQYLSRFLAVVCFDFVLGWDSVGAFAWVYAAFVGTAALVAMASVQFAYGSPSARLANLRGSWREGMSFAFGASSRVVYTDIDKVLIARLATLETAGLYGAAYRSISLALMPLLALFMATYADFFRRGAEGIAPAYALAKRVTRWTLLYGLVATLLILLLAFPLMNLFGPDFVAAVPIVWLLAPLPLLKALYLPLGDALTGSGYQASRTAVQIGCGALNLTLCILLIPGLSWMGAVIATLATEIVMVAAYGVLVAQFVQREKSRDRSLEPTGAA